MAEQSKLPKQPERSMEESIPLSAARAAPETDQEVAIEKTERPPAKEPQAAEGVPLGTRREPSEQARGTAFLVCPLAPTLVNAQIEFATLDDDKDQKTLLTVTVVDFERVVAARVSSRFGRFVDHTENGPFNLRVLNASTRTSLQRGAVTICIDTDDDDTWKFNFFLLLTFSDGSTLQAGGSQLGLSDPGGDFSPELTVGIGGTVGTGGR